MVLPGGFEKQIALFSIASVKPSTPWLTGATKRALDQSYGGDLPLVYVTEDEVDTAGWSLQKVAEWVVKHICTKEDERACDAFVVADDKSEETDSLLIVALDGSTFGRPDPYADDPEACKEWLQNRVTPHRKDLASRYPESNPDPKVVIDRAFRASPELCIDLTSLISSGIRDPWMYETGIDNPDDLDLVYKYDPPSAEELAEWERNKDKYPTIYFDEESKEDLEVSNEYHETCIAGATYSEKFEVISMPSYRLANGKYLATMKWFPADAFDKEPLPQVKLGDEGMVTVLGRYTPEKTECDKDNDA